MHGILIFRSVIKEYVSYLYASATEYNNIENN
jgi:hypothetical protein